VDYPLSAYHKGKTLRVGQSVFCEKGVKLDIRGKGVSLRGILHYGGLTPIDGDIMGPFRFLPMECRHGITSMRHNLIGTVTLNGEKLDFTGGVGYIESDSGYSFPDRYTWIHCNQLGGDCSIMASVARIPLCGLRFWGCICVVWLNGREYRLATYKVVRVIRCGPGGMVLEQGGLRLEITVQPQNGHMLAAPRLGVMSRTIRENASCPAAFRFTKGGRVLFEGKSRYASFEYV